MVASVIQFFFDNKPFFVVIVLVSFLLKLYLILYGLSWKIRKTNPGPLLLLLTIFLAGSACTEICYAISLLRKIVGATTESHLFTLLCRINYASFITRYQAFALLLEKLIEKERKFKNFDLLHLLVNVTISSGFLFLALFKFYVPSHSPETLSFEIKLVQAIFLYLPFLFIPLLFKIYRKILFKQIPQILEHQLHLLCLYLIPYLIMETLGNPHSYLAHLFSNPWRTIYFCYTIATIICAHALVSKKIISLRFLDLKKSVESSEKFSFLIRFQGIFEQMGKATSLEDLSYLTQIFFHSAFSVSSHTIKLYCPKLYEDIDSIDLENKPEKLEAVEYFANTYWEVCDSIMPKIFIRDEVEFTYFYEKDTASREIISFLDSIDAEIFLPIYDKKSVIAYVVVERGTQLRRFFTNKEHHEMLVFSSYLRNIIYLLKFSRVEALYYDKNDIKKELLSKEEEIIKYRETIGVFMRASRERNIGILYYKNHRFVLANEAAHELISVDINSSKDHELNVIFRTLVDGIQRFGKSLTIDVNLRGNRLIISGVQSPFDTTIIFHVYYPHISENLRLKFDKLSVLS